MTDYLSGDMGDGGDEGYLGGGDGGYLGLDDPAMPTAPGAPPADPYSSTTGGSTGGGYLDGGEPQAAPGFFDGAFAGDSDGSGGGYLDGGTSGGDAGWGEPVQQQDAGGYFADAQQQAPAATPTMPAQQQYAEPVHSMGVPGELSIEAPMLEEVHAPTITPGGTRGNLSSLVLDVEVQVEVYFGDAALTVEQFLEMGRGTVLELDHSIEAPIELRVKGKRVATGQLVTINGNYGLRILEMEGR